MESKLFHTYVPWCKGFLLLCPANRINFCNTNICQHSYLSPIILPDCPFLYNNLVVRYGS